MQGLTGPAGRGRRTQQKKRKSERTGEDEGGALNR